jgi:hypothetical protein
MPPSTSAGAHRPLWLVWATCLPIPPSCRLGKQPRFDQGESL